ncbi:L-ascorbate metabolism protein UlaG (beta-lactamase superfamily) [Halanaerobium saccharolyticum]|uniref:L-ascorbate metabolism protein UlaG (Beta-lactamase superfamily) n=1 Tax=Halanaerobium saccharolyticum TaxID=43595 RepID=A0A4R6M097_9FIRM|nr:MBL fold metallo-hydrolase [Halanaerobium saccharolyticum]TDO94326.1 L-ascorbate metabolism protein UlaG (beta-lactamase superfamily) [Halanaerobium saccharolyticum]
MQTEIYHLFHSGTAVRVENKLFIFDYYKDQPQQEKTLQSSLEKGIVREDSFKNITEAYVFVSHSHHDHYNQVIFDWEKYCNQINYILAAEVEPATELKNKDNLYLMEKDEKLQLENINISSYGSTDKGVSFLVELEDLSIFHAGDLNWWKWKKFTEKVQKREAREYKREVEKFKDKQIDIAFVPVDPRLEEHYYLAGEYFIDQVKPALFVPIHFADNYDVTKFFRDRFNSNQTRVAEITEPGEKILYTRK